jgi:transmembrane sensor
MRHDDTSTDPRTGIPDETLFDRYLAGECTDAERETLDAWLRAHPDHAARLGIITYVAANPVAEMRRVDAAAAFGTFLSRTRSEAIAYGAHRTGIVPVLWRRMGYVLASVVTVLLMLVGYAHFATRARTHLPVTTYTTANAQRANLTLPDGSLVSLGVDSRLDVPGDYAMGNRTLKLTGEAMFTVTNHANQPFRVITAKTTTEVLGTSFVVRRYATDTTTNVAVRSGKVSVHDGAMQPIVLATMQQVDLGPGRDIHVHAVDPSRFDFVTGVLEFKGAPLSEVATELGRWYDVEIRLGDSTLADRHVTGGFMAGSRADLAEILAEPLGVRVVQDGRILTLYRR